MSHRLCPPEGRPFLEPEEVVERLREEFAFCDADRDQGADDVGDMIAKLIELKAPKPIIDAAIAGRDRSFSVSLNSLGPYGPPGPNSLTPRRSQVQKPRLF
jgi:hypothetical protein